MLVKSSANTPIVAEKEQAIGPARNKKFKISFGAINRKGRVVVFFNNQNPANTSMALPAARLKVIDKLIVETVSLAINTPSMVELIEPINTPNMAGLGPYNSAVAKPMPAAGQIGDAKPEGFENIEPA